MSPSARPSKRENADDEAELSSLVEQATLGLDGAFELLASRTRERVRRWAYRVTADSDDADDIAQLVLLRLADRLASFDRRGRFTGWLRRTTLNLAIDHARAASRRARIELQADVCAEDDRADDATSSELRTLIGSCMQVLSKRQYEILVLSDLHGMNSVEVARRTGLSASTVRVHLARARLAMRIQIMDVYPSILKRP